MFMDFKSDKEKDNLHKMDNQFMLGSHIMVSPVLITGERKKKTYFPDELFYNFYDGKLMNPEGEKNVLVDASLQTLPLFFRAGFITPVQDATGVTKISEM